MSQSSTFLTQEPVLGPLNCRPTPDVALYFDGATSVVPTLSATGLILFTGAVANRPAPGIGFTGKDNVFNLPYSSILDGGAGVKLRCVTPATKEKLRITTVAGNASPSTTNIAFRLGIIQSCNNPQEYDKEDPIYVYYRAGVIDTVPQKLAAFRDRFNAKYAQLGTATIGGSGANSYVDIETLNVGERFRVEVSAGITVSHITPGFKGTYTADLIPDWFPGTAAPSGDPKAIELFTKKDFPVQTAGVATSNFSQSTQGLQTVEQTVTLVTANNTNGNAYLEALKTILRGPASGNLAQKYIAKLVGDDCADVPLYDYTISRSDAGNDAALATLRSDYPAAVNVWRTEGTSSVYHITTASNTAPTAASGDTVVVGG